jgi:large subunit ribosomal protein L28
VVRLPKWSVWSYIDGLPRPRPVDPAEVELLTVSDHTPGSDFTESVMSRVCQISKVKGQSGHRVSHANNKTKHVFQTNLQNKRFFVPELNKFVRVRVSTRIIRTIDKIGFMNTLKKFKLDLAEITK